MISTVSDLLVFPTALLATHVYWPASDGLEEDTMYDTPAPTS